MSSVKDFLDSISKPAPELPDIEDSENVDGTWAHRSQKPLPIADHDQAEIGQRHLHVVTEDGEPKYAGKVISSKAVFGDSEMSGLAQSIVIRSEESNVEEDDSLEEEDDEEESDGEDSERSENTEMEGGTSERDVGTGQVRRKYVKGDKEITAASENSEQSSTEDMEGDEVDEKSIKMESALAAVSLESQKKKGESIRKQLLIWDRLMHIQIKLHAALRAYNQLPRGELAKRLLREADEETVRNYRQVRKNTVVILDTLMQAEDALLLGSKQTASITGTSNKVNQDGDDSEDEEIASSLDENEDEEDMKDEMEGDDDDASIPDYKEEATASGDEEQEEEEQDKESRRKGRHSLRQIEAELAKRHKRFEEFRNSTLKKWDERTRLVGFGAAKSAKHNFSAFDSVVLTQIAQIMADKHRLIRRTQTKRSDTERIGGNAEATFDVELFDDDDFYQQLLKDLIERKSAEIADPIEMSKQWLEMQKLRQKRSKNKKVDTKASKGRKIRYVVIPKLVNYFPSAPEKVKWTHETRNQLFKSLFAP